MKLWLSSFHFTRDMLLTAAGILIAVGAIVLVATVSGKTLARAAGGTPIGEKVSYVVGAIICATGVICGMAALLFYEDDTTISPYDRYLVGTGYALALLAVINFTALIGFQLSGQLSAILNVNFTDKQSDNTLQRGVFLALLPGFAVLGALFFHANSLRKMRDSLNDDAAELVATKSQRVVTNQPASGLEAGMAMKATIAPTTSHGIRASGGSASSPKAADGQTNAAASSLLPTVIEASSTSVLKADQPSKSDKNEPFSPPRFWAGLWFRMGEALLFALICLLVAQGSKLQTFSGPTLLILSLLLGMFVKSGETLIAGLADRLFNAVQALVKG